MRSNSFRFALAGLAALAIAGCASAYRWGATDDPEYTARIGNTTFTKVTSELGQPVAKINLPSGDMKARWFARPMTMSGTRGTMEDDSVEHTEERSYWRDMRFDKNGNLTRAWMSDQRQLADSEAP